MGAEHEAVQASHEALIAENKVAKETLVSQLSQVSGELDTVRASHEAMSDEHKVVQ